MPARKKEEANTGTKRTRKSKGTQEMERLTALNSEFQRQGMADVWQLFYAKVKLVVEEEDSFSGAGDEPRK